MIVLRHTDDTRSEYDRIYDGDAINQMDSFFLWIQAVLRLRAGESLLDVSTGRGRMVALARQRGVLACGLDFSMRACELAQEIAGGHVVNTDGQRLPFSNDRFDAATNLGSLEHFEFMDLGVSELARVLKPGGRACLTLPNSFGLLWNVAAAWKTGDVSDDGQPLQRYGTLRQWQGILEHNGLKITRVLGYEHEHAFPRTRRDLSSYWFHPKRALIMLSGRLIPVTAAGQYVFVCYKPCAADSHAKE